MPAPRRARADAKAQAERPPAARAEAPRPGRGNQARLRAGRAADPLAGEAIRLGDPHDPSERRADEVAGLTIARLHPAPLVRALTARAHGAGGAVGQTGEAAPPSVDRVLAEPGRQLEPAILTRMAGASGPPLDAVRVHTGGLAARAAADVGAAAWTVGNHIAFAPGAFRPGTPGGDRLIAHELAHVAEQGRSGRLTLARSPEEWLETSRLIEGMTYPDLKTEADALGQWIHRQTRSSPELDRIQEVLGEIEHEIARRDARAFMAGKPAKRAKGRGPAAKPAPLPDRRPRILSRMGSEAHMDPAEIRDEYDLIVRWLGRSDLPRPERAILEAERANLEPLLREQREGAATERHVARVRRALSSDETDLGGQLSALAETIENIVADEANPELFYMYDRGERIPISRDQRDMLRTMLRDQLIQASWALSGIAAGSVNAYRRQVGVNKEFPVTSFLSGVVGGATDPGEALIDRAYSLKVALVRMRNLVAAGRMREASALLPQLERNAQIVDAMSSGFIDDHMAGAGRIVTGLTITATVAFTVAGGLAAVAAAPFVAGAIGVSGVLGTGLTMLGTGGVVAGGSFVVRGGAAAAGVGLAGGSAEEALDALWAEGKSGAREGFIAGAGGAAARALAPFLGVGTQAGGQALRRVAAEAIVNSSSTFLDMLASGASPEEALKGGLRSAVLSVPGAALSGNSRLARELAGPLLSSATAYYGAIDSGATMEEARRAATVAFASGIVTGRAMRGRHGADAQYGQKGAEIRRPVAPVEAPAPAPAPLPAIEPAPAQAAPPAAQLPVSAQQTGQAEPRAPASASAAHARARAAADPIVDRELDQAFRWLRRGKLKSGQGALLGDLMIHEQRKEALDMLRAELGPIRSRPARTPEGVDVNPAPGLQSAHSAAQAPLRELPHYDPNKMITRFLWTGKGHEHTLFDQHWQRECRAMRDRRETLTAQKLYEVTSRAARESGAFSPEVAESVSALVYNDLFFHLGLAPDTPLRMPGPD